MANDDELKIRGTMDNSDIDRKLKSLASNFRALGETLNVVTMGVALGSGIGAGLAIVGQALNAIGGALNFVKDSAIGMNASLETTTLQFTTLMGDADKATEHVRGLFEFAKNTPFETQPIIEASRMLEVFGGSALNTEHYLTMVGDAAAAVSAPINEVAFWTGRLYTQLQAGKPIGEAAMRLQELAIMSPQARIEMERLIETGASADEIWAIFTQDMDRFTGAMEAQANTWEGLSSSAVDSVNILSAQAFKPLFDLARSALKSLNELLNSEWAQGMSEKVATALQGMIDNLYAMVGNAVNAFASMDNQTARSLGRIAGYLDGLGQLAVSWGTGIVNAIAQGIIESLNVVVWALNQLGNMIAYWLEPHSPPNLLPDLDKWGAETATVYLQSWGDADFNALRDFGREIQSILSGLVVTGGMDEEDVLPTVLAARDAFAEAVAQFRELGHVTEEAFGAIQTAAGDAGTEAVALARAYFNLAEAQNDLSEAQQHLNEVTARYDRILAPLNAQLAALTNQQQDLEDANRIRSLQQLLTQQGLSPERRQQIELEIQEIELAGQIRDIEQARQDEITAAEQAVDTAQDAVNEAQTQYELLQSTLGVQQDTLDIMGQQEALMDRLAGLAETIASAIEDIPTALELALKPLNEQLQKIQMQQDEMRDLHRLAEINQALQSDTLTEFERQTLELEKQEIATRRQIRQLQAAEIGLDLSPLALIPITLEDIANTSGGAGKGIGDAVGAGLAEGLEGMGATIDNAVTGLFDPEKFNFDETLEGDLERIRQQFEEGFGEGGLAFENSINTLNEKFGELSTTFDTAISSIQPYLDKLGELGQFLSDVAGGWEGLGEKLEWANEKYLEILPILMAIFSPLHRVGLILDTVKGSVEGAGETFEEWFGQSVPDVVGTFSDYWGEKTTLWSENAENALGLVDQALLRLSEQLGVNVPADITTFSGLWSRTVSDTQTEFDNWYNQHINPTLTAVQGWFNDKMVVALADFKTAWNRDVQEAGDFIDGVWNNQIQPIFNTLDDILSIRIPDSLDTFLVLWALDWGLIQDAMEPKTDKIQDFLEDVMDAVDDLKRKIERFIAWLLTLQVPNPFEGVANAIGGGGDAGKEGGSTEKSLMTLAGMDTTITAPSIGNVGGDVFGKEEGSGGDTTNNYYDLRGSNWTREELKALIKEALNEEGRRADRLTRTTPARPSR
jgi:hypothetical protein